MSYKDGIANFTGRIGESKADQFFMKNGLCSCKPPGLDTGIDRFVCLNNSSGIRAKVQIKSRRQIANPRWFQLSITPAQIYKAIQDKIDLNELWKMRIDMVDFWIHGIKSLEKRQPTEDEILRRQQELIKQEPTPEAKQKHLFGRVIFKKNTLELIK